jgi:2-haloacid dehalogenase
VFDVAPEQVMLVAAHHDDLAAPRACGLRTASCRAPLRVRRDAPKDVAPTPGNDLHGRDLLDLADQLGCPAAV